MKLLWNLQRIKVYDLKAVELVEILPQFRSCPDIDLVLNSEASPVRKGFGSCCVAKTKESTSETKPLETQQSQDVPQVQAESTTPQHGSETSDHISSEESPILPSTEVDKECRSSTPTVEDKEQNDDTEPTAKNTTGCCSPIPHTHQELSQSMANLSPILKDPDPIPQVEQHPLVQQNPTYVGPDLEAHQDNYTAILPANHPHGPEEYLPQTANTEFQYNYNIPASHAMVPRQILMQEPYSTMWSHENMNVSADNSAACLCGDGCECLGCPVHPFNNTTRNEVRELNDILEADMAAEYDAQNLPNQLDGSILTSPVEASARFQDFRRGSNFQYGYDVQYSRPPSNHAAAAVISSPPEYDTFQFVFQYCMGRADICLCGPGCACPGCLTHNNAPTPGGYRNLIHQGADMSMNTHPPNPMAMISNSFVLPNVAANPIQDQYQTHYQNQFHGGFKGSARYPDSNQPPPPLDMLDPADIPFQQRSMPQ